MTSEDVIHDFYIPAFRLKQDVLPGRYTQMWFRPTRLGTYHLFCAEYCGTFHSRMGGSVVVMKPADYARWLRAGNEQPTMEKSGEKLFTSLGCSGCHGDNSNVRAPSLNGIYNQPVALQNPNGTTTVVTADDRYLRDSILLPASQIVAVTRTSCRLIRQPERRTTAATHSIHQIAEPHRNHSTKLVRHDQQRQRRQHCASQLHASAGATTANAREWNHRAARAAENITPNITMKPRLHPFAVAPTKPPGVLPPDIPPSTPQSAPQVLAGEESYLSETGWRSWLFTQDHKRIAILYMLTITGFFVIGGLAASLMRLELATPKPDLLRAQTYNKAFTMHGVIMVWFFLIPSIPNVLGNFLIPLMIGAKDLAFPKLNLASWYLFVFSGLLTFCAMLAGGVDTGWTFYTPYSTMFSNGAVLVTVVGVILAAFPASSAA